MACLVFGTTSLSNKICFRNKFQLTEHTCSESKRVPTPIVIPIFGTLEMSQSKNWAFATQVSIASVFTRVLETNDEPGSLNPM